MLLVIAGFVAVGILLAVTVRRAKAQGLNPLTMQTDLTARLLQADALSPAKSITERLEDLDRLLAAGTITPTQHATARAAVLSGR